MFGYPNVSCSGYTFEGFLWTQTFRGDFAAVVKSKI